MSESENLRDKAKELVKETYDVMAELVHEENFGSSVFNNVYLRDLEQSTQELLQIYKRF